MMDSIRNRPSADVMDSSPAPASCNLVCHGSERTKDAGKDSAFPFAADPAVMVALGIRFGLIGRARRQGIPASVRDGLRHHASQGEPACQLVLGWLDDMVLAEIEALEVAPLA